MSLAEDKVYGFSCSWCGVYFEAEHGFPVLCDSCWDEAIDKHGNDKIILGKFGLQKAIHSEL